MEPMGSEQLQQKSPQKSDLASPVKTTERDVASKQGVESIASHASPTGNGACMSSSPSTSSGTSPASGVGSSHHSPANSIGTSPIGGASRHSQQIALVHPQLVGPVIVPNQLVVPVVIVQQNIWISRKRMVNQKSLVQ